MSDSGSRQTKQEKQAEMLRHNLILRKKQVEERERLKQEKADKKRQNSENQGK